MVADAVDHAPEVRRTSIITRARRARQVAPAVLRLNAAVRQRAARAHRLEQSSLRGFREEARRDHEALDAAVIADHLDPRALRRRRARRPCRALALARALVVAVPRQIDGVRGNPPTRSSCVAVFDARRAVLLALRRRGEAALVVRVRIKNFDDALACRCGGRRGRRVVVAVSYRYHLARARGGSSGSWCRHLRRLCRLRRTTTAATSVSRSVELPQQCIIISHFLSRSKHERRRHSLRPGFACYS